MSNNTEALIAKIKKQLENFDTVILKEDEALSLIAPLEKKEVVIPTIWRHYGCGHVASIYEQAMDDAGVKWRSVDD